MCFYSDAGTDFYSESFPIAAKVHRCGECPRTINPGDQYFRWSCKYDGEMQSDAMCLTCYVARVKVHQHELTEGCRWEESWCPGGGLSSYLGEFGLTIEAVAAGAPIAYAVIGDDE
jgi:hypothetical protein